MSVQALLKQAQGAHEAFQRASRAQNYAVSTVEAVKALEFRQAAHEADPEHTDPEWQAWKHKQHEELIAFYVKYPTIP